MLASACMCSHCASKSTTAAALARKAGDAQSKLNSLPVVDRLQNDDFPVKEAHLLHAALPLQMLDCNVVLLLVGNNTDSSERAFANLLVSGFGVRSSHRRGMPICARLATCHCNNTARPALKCGSRRKRYFELGAMWTEQCNHTRAAMTMFACAVMASQRTKLLIALLKVHSCQHLGSCSSS